MDVVGYQSGHGDNDLYLRWVPEGPPSWSWRLDPPRPFINLEPPYEGHLSYHTKTVFDAAIVRRHIFWSLLVSPVAGVGYGCQGIWGWDTRADEVPFACSESGLSRLWFESLDYPGAESLRYMVELFESFRWWEMRPAPDLVANQPGDADSRMTVLAASTADGSHSIAYVPAGSSLHLCLGSLPKRPVSAAWVNPRTGQQTPCPLPDGSKSWSPPLPDADDWVLLLTTAEHVQS